MYVAWVLNGVILADLQWWFPGVKWVGGCHRRRRIGPSESLGGLTSDVAGWLIPRKRPLVWPWVVREGDGGGMR